MSEILSSRAHTLWVVPLGRHSAEQLDLLMKRLEQVYRRVRCDLLKGPGIPEECYDSRMKAYVAKNVLDFLDATYGCKPGEKILGVTDADLCLLDSHVPGYLFGLARQAGKAALVSSRRLLSYPPKEDDGSHLVERLTKEAMHELGHLSDLSHCHNITCVMSGSKTTRGIDRKRFWYCLRCRERATLRPGDDNVLAWDEPVI